MMGAFKDKVVPTDKNKEKKIAPAAENRAENRQDIAQNNLLEKIPNVSSFVFNGPDGEMISLDNVRLIYKKLDDLASDELLKLDKLDLTNEDRNKFVEEYLQQVRHLRRLVGKGNKGVYKTFGVFETPLENLENKALENKVMDRIAQ